jgi:hypothetical protein
MKSGFFFDTAHAMPRSCGVTVPSVSCPMIRVALLGAQHGHGLGAVGVMPRGRPAASSRSTPRVRAAIDIDLEREFTGKLTRARRTGTPSRVVSRHVEREGVVGDVHVTEHRADDVPGPRPTTGNVAQ